MKSSRFRELVQTYPLVQTLAERQPVAWFVEHATPACVALADVGLTAEDVAQARDRLDRFAPYLAIAFSETSDSHGQIESSLHELTSLRAQLGTELGEEYLGSVWAKKDNELSVSGSIKARGGIYEVLKYAEQVALAEGLLDGADCYAQLHSPEARAVFAKYQIVVGSTGNLGLSIGIAGASFGFRVSVHMSADAKDWKKQRLRASGVDVIEHAGDYSLAVECARESAIGDYVHFVDDENSKDLFLGYATAASRLAKQLEQAGILVDEQHPLLVYLPCGVGGAPGGVSFGLKLEFGDNVHCIFAEPVSSPCMLLGVYTGLHNHVSVKDIGLDSRTIADGLAVGRASGFVGRAMSRLIDGYFTVEDERLATLVGAFYRQEQLRVEPSAVSGYPGITHVLGDSAYQTRMGLSTERLKNATHLLWLTGGGMLPEHELAQYLE